MAEHDDEFEAALIDFRRDARMHEQRANVGQLYEAIEPDADGVRAVIALTDAPRVYGIPGTAYLYIRGHDEHGRRTGCDATDLFATRWRPVSLPEGDLG